MLLGDNWASWWTWRGEIGVDGAVVESATVRRVEITKHAPQLIELGLVLLLPRLDPAHLTNQRVLALVATGEVLLLPCPVDAGVKLHPILRAMALLRFIMEAYCITSALIHLRIIKIRGFVALVGYFPMRE